MRLLEAVSAEAERGYSRRSGQPAAGRIGGPIPALALFFYGTLYVDMIPEEVPVLWVSFSSAVS